MTDLKLILGFGLATGAAAAFAYVVVTNWRAVAGALRRKEGRPRSLVFLAGPILLVALVQGLRLIAPLSGTAVLVLLGMGLLVDPAAIPVLAFVAYRRMRRGSRPGGRIE